MLRMFTTMISLRRLSLALENKVFMQQSQLVITFFKSQRNCRAIYYLPIYEPQFQECS